MITCFQQCVPHNLHLGVLQVPLVTCLRWCCHPCTTPWGKTWLGLASLWLLGPRQPSYLGWVPRGCRGPGGCATWGVGLTYVRGGWTLLGWASVGLWHLLGGVCGNWACRTMEPWSLFPDWGEHTTDSALDLWGRCWGLCYEAGSTYPRYLSVTKFHLTYCNNCHQAEGSHNSSHQLSRLLTNCNHGH